MERGTTIGAGAAGMLLLGAWFAWPWLAGSPGSREPAAERARTVQTTAPESSASPPQPASTDVRRRGASVVSEDGAAKNDSSAAAPERDLALAEVEARALIGHLLRLDELRDVRAIERAIEAFLARWGSAPEFDGALQSWLWCADPPWPREELQALALIARCWLASALASGLYAPEAAQRFALELVQRAAGAESEAAIDILRAVLGQSGEDEAPQLMGLPQLGAALLGHLDHAQGTRAALIELLEDWGAREASARPLLAAMLEDPDDDLRACAYRALLRADPLELDVLRDVLRAEEPQLLRSIASWMIQRPDGLGFAALRDLVSGIDSGSLAALHVASLGRDYALSRALADPTAFDAAWRSLEGDESRSGSELREGLLQGLGLVKPTRQQIDLLFDASFDPRLRSSALQALASAAPSEAALRLRELALAPAIEDRCEAIFACGNALARGAPPLELIEALSALLDDPRIDRLERERLAEKLSPHIPERIAAWRRAIAR